MTRLTAQAYTVAWLCALPLSELVVATAMLDEEHDPLGLSAHDENSYTYGSINGHNVVIACMPPGQPGKVSASKLVQPLSQSFPNLKIHLFVGIGSGVPRIPPPEDPEKDVHLGDVVIGWAEQTGAPGVVQWDLARYLEDGNVKPLGVLDKPDRRLLNGLGSLLARHRLGKTKFPEHLTRLQKFADFSISHPGLEHDKLFKSTYHHMGGPNCASCDRAQLVTRLPRVNQRLIFHQGTIVSGDTVMEDPQRRDEISQIYYNALCFEMEAAGVMDDKRCLIIRGISDYADSHKSDLWQDYAAGTAAAFAREFLFTIGPQVVHGMESATEVLPAISTAATSTTKVYFMVPFQRNGDLIGREEIIQKLETKLCVPNKYSRVALVGLGGIGKTRIALEYASKYRNSDSVSVCWVHASTPERMEKSYQEIAREATLVGAKDPKVDQFQLVKQWLESDGSGNWIMIIDNADDEKLFYGEDKGPASDPSSFSSKMARYLPQRPNGSILLTTRNKKLGVKFAPIRGVMIVPKMSLSESKRLLLENLEEDDHDDYDLMELAGVLENLPLALVQATAFIRENSQSIGEYLQTYRGSDSAKIELLSQNFEDYERDPESKNPVAVTWAISFEQIRRNDLQAAKLLSLMSVLDRQTIPKSLLSLGSEELELEKALGTLKAFSLITSEPNRQVFNLHRLVYLATRNWLNINKELDSWTGKALVLLSEFFPDPNFENRETWMAYLPHAHSILNSDHLPPNEDIAQATLLDNVSWALQEKGDYDPAKIMARKCLDLREKVLGEKDYDTLRSLGNLGWILYKQGKAREAEELHRQALDGFEDMFGKEHVGTLNSVNNLAVVLDDQSKYEAAEKLYRRALSGREKLLGDEHPDTLGSVSNLGVVLHKQGKYKAAEKLYRRVLSDREKLLGDEHPNTLDSVSNLGVVLHKQGKYEAAEKLYRRALSGREKLLGDEHPDTLWSVNNLGLALDRQGKYEVAEKLYRRALSGREKILGDEHPDTLWSVNSLGVMFDNQGKYEAAEKLHRRALRGREKILGDGHPDTLLSVNNMAVVLEEQGKYEAAEKLHRRALSGREKVLGDKHPDTLGSINSLGVMFDNQGKYEAAEKLHRRALRGREKILGDGHPDTLLSVNNMAVVLEKQGKYEAAEKLYRRALSGREKLLGDEHPDTLWSVNSLGVMFGNQGKYEAAEKLYRRALSGREKVLGKEHPDTFHSAHNLAVDFHRQFQYQEALPLYQRACAGLEKTLGSDHPDTQLCAENYRLLLTTMEQDSEATSVIGEGEDDEDDEEDEDDEDMRQDSEAPNTSSIGEKEKDEGDEP